MNKLVHICLTGAVTEGFSYQDNLLPIYQKKLGYVVTFITSKWIYNDEGMIVTTSQREHLSRTGIKIIRLESKSSNTYSTKIKTFYGLYETLSKERPNIIFIHGVQFREVNDVIKYKKKYNDTLIYVDNHADFSNSGRNFLSKNILHKVIWRHYAKKLEPYVKKFYGVLPARVDWMINVYGIHKSRVDLLVMGADDEQVIRVADEYEQSKIRDKHGLGKFDFVIVTGGKIDAFKKQTLTLMKAFSRLKNQTVKMIIFGSIDNSIIAEFNDLLVRDDRIKYIGWIDNKYSYDIFSVANIVAFPGRHSVYWEQAVGMGVPMICKYWNGTNHVDIGGNVKYINNDTESEIYGILYSIINEENVYLNMRKAAQSDARKMFLYSNIAKKSLEI